VTVQLSLLYSQIASSISVSALSAMFTLKPQGFTNAPGSVKVTSICMWPKSARRNRSVTCSASVCDTPYRLTHVLSLNPALSTTSVSPSHRPTEYPM
jgi:hypothetical protein